MTISAYQVDNIIKAYNKQSKAKFLPDAQQSPSPDRYADLVTLSGSDSLRADANKKISYSLLDVLLKDKKIEP
ncbi:MAG: hypothetical protein D4R64_03180 [Porphyromonadaceae bacterium]|nr:MAG: hypothetical protein D4R64_03180 [Porphyromonadaceae bacterium]